MLLINNTVYTFISAPVEWASHCPLIDGGQRICPFSIWILAFEGMLLLPSGAHGQFLFNSEPVLGGRH